MDAAHAPASDHAHADGADPGARVCWVVSDGRIGIENQALGLAEAVARLTPLTLVRRVAPRLGVVSSALLFLAAQVIARHRARLQRLAPPADAPPPPDLWIGCGRAAIAQAWADRQLFAHRAPFIYVQDPRGSYDQFDLIIAPEHDGLTRVNTLAVLGAPNRITPERLEQAAAEFPDLAGLPRPRIAALIGGRSKRHAVSAAAAEALWQRLAAHAEGGGGLMITTSRRTPPDIRAPLRALAAAHAHVRVWTGPEDGPNPYLAYLATADLALVTQDSVNMLTDAASAGVPALIAPMAGRDGKLARLYDALIARGAARWFDGDLAPWPVTPLNETARAAEAVAALLSGEGRSASSR